MAFKTKARVNEYAKEWREKNREKWLEYRRRNRAKHALRYKNSDRELNWKRRGIICTTEQYDSLMAAQKGVCAICSEPEKRKGLRLAVDHDHTNGKIRGLLCARCNANVLPAIERWDYLIESARRYLGGI